MSKNILYLNTMSKSTLRDLRVAKGVDIEYIAEHMGVTVNYVRDLESFKVNRMPIGDVVSYLQLLHMRLVFEIEEYEVKKWF